MTTYGQDANQNEALTPKKVTLLGPTPLVKDPESAQRIHKPKLDRAKMKVPVRHDKSRYHKGPEQLAESKPEFVRLAEKEK